MDPTRKSTIVTHEKPSTRKMKSRVKPSVAEKIGQTSAVPLQAPAALPWTTPNKEFGRESKPWAQPEVKAPPQAQREQHVPTANASIPVPSSYLSMDLFSPPSRRYHGHKFRINEDDSRVRYKYESHGAVECKIESSSTRPIHPRYYAVDAEMVMAVGPGDVPERRVMVSVGIVNQRLETVLYSRVRVPDGCQVTNGAFARVEGGLWASWDEGVPTSCISDFLARHVSAGGVIVGWELHGDLEVIGFEKAAALVKKGHREGLPVEVAAVSSPSRSSTPSSSAPASSERPRKAADQQGDERPTGDGRDGDDPIKGPGCSTSPEDHVEGGVSSGNANVFFPRGEANVTGMRVVEVTDHFRTSKSGLKCMLSEAYSSCFDRKEEGVHNAATDARMTMELYNLWRRVGSPKMAIGTPLSLFIVNFHSFKTSEVRNAMLWGILRPERAGRQILLEKDSGMNTYKLCFRNERERDAYVTLLETRMAAEGLEWEKLEDVPGRRGTWGGYQLSCQMFKMHVLDIER